MVHVRACRAVQGHAWRGPLRIAAVRASSADGATISASASGVTIKSPDLAYLVAVHILFGKQGPPAANAAAFDIRLRAPWQLLLSQMMQEFTTNRISKQT